MNAVNEIALYTCRWSLFQIDGLCLLEWSGARGGSGGGCRCGLPFGGEFWGVLILKDLLKFLHHLKQGVLCKEVGTVMDAIMRPIHDIHPFGPCI